MVLGLTGSIATGKSTVSNILLNLDIEIVDADKISREVIADEIIIKKLIDTFEDILTDGKIDRIKLRKTVFENEENIKKINQIMHPVIISKMLEKIKGKKFIVVDAPLLFEVGFDQYCDKILVIACSQDEQIERIVKRDNSTKENALKIIQSQMSLDEKIKKSDYVIYNDKDLKYLEKQVYKLIKN